MFRKCGSCFRYIEDWKDAYSKGLPNRKNIMIEHSYKPRLGVKAICCMVGGKEEPKNSDFGCKHHKYRFIWNFKEWWQWSFSYKLKRWFDLCIRSRIGGLRKPVHLEWVDDYSGIADKIIPKSNPKCPHCGEMPYSLTQCVFCGQRFISEEHDIKTNEPSKT